MSASPALSPDGQWYWNGSAWASLLSADGSQRWNGGAWVARDHTTAGGPTQPSPQAPVAGRPINKAWLLAGGGAIALLFFGSIVTTQFIHLHAYLKPVVTGAATATDFAAEQTYGAVYKHDVLAIQADTVPYTPTSTTPGVCNKGGTKQGCYDTDQKVVRDLRSMQADLGRLTVPPRFKKADSDLRAGLKLNIDGLLLRDQAIASNDPNATFGPSNQMLQQAVDQLHKAYTEFPTDNAPQPKL
jgi:hypothetical protein